MRAYEAFFYSATQAQSKTVAAIQQPSSALKRLSIQYFHIGHDVSADNEMHVQLKRSTSAGTSTAFTPVARDPADGAASALGGQNFSGEPTYTSGAIMLECFYHQRAGFQWYAAPGHEIVIPVTNNNGIGAFMAAMGASANTGGAFEYEE